MDPFMREVEEGYRLDPPDNSDRPPFEVRTADWHHVCSAVRRGSPVRLG